MRHFIRQTLIGTWQVLRGTCLVAGMCLALLLVGEVVVRVIDRMTGANNHSVSVPDSYRTSSWYWDYLRDYDGATPQRWLPYLYFGRRPSYQSRTVNIDSLGNRITPQRSDPAGPSARVYFLGGSTLWGTGQRDDRTIPAEVARRLQALQGPGGRVEVLNLGETGYVSTQELLKLMLMLRDGDRPDVVVFYDGINDAFATLQAGMPGLTQNEFKRRSEFELGRAIDQNVLARGVRKDLHAWRMLASAAMEQSALYRKLVSLRPAVPQKDLLPAERAAEGTAHDYAENVKVIEALGKTYGFTPLYIWQPTIHATDKVLTPFEARVMASIRADSFQNRLRQVHLALTPLVDSLVAPVAGARFIDATTIFQGDSGDVFIDRIGHNTEASVPKIVDVFWPALQAALLPVLQRGQH